MKKISFRSIVWGLLITASLFSYLYLSSLSDDYSAEGSANAAIQEGTENSPEDGKVFLPDIALVKKIINVTKIVMPRD